MAILNELNKILLFFWTILFKRFKINLNPLKPELSSAGFHIAIACNYRLAELHPESLS